VSAVLQGGLHPQSWRLTASVCLGLAALVLVPALWTPVHVLLVAGAILVGTAVVFSVRRSLVALVLMTTALPAHLIDSTALPLGMRPEEILLAAAFVFAFMDLVHVRGLNFCRVRPDGLVYAFLFVASISMLVGFYHGNEPSVVLRNGRYAFYYAAFLLTVQAVDSRTAVRVFVPLFVVAGLAVSAEYILQFVAGTGSSVSGEFVRLGRRQGVFLPVSLLLLANVLLHDPKRWGRVLPFGLFLVMGVAFALTLGRGMWVSFALGLIASVWLREAGLPAWRRRMWRPVAIAVSLLVVLVGAILFFQRLTGAAISAHAVERSRTFVDYTRDVQVLGRILNYANAVEAIAEHPILGNGQGTTLTSYSFDPDTGRFGTWTSWTVDSLYLTLWLKLGLAGLVVFPALCLGVLRRSRAAFMRATDPSTRAFTAAGVAIVLAMLVLGLSDGSMLNGRFALVFAILFGLLSRVAADVLDAPAAPTTQPEGPT